MKITSFVHRIERAYEKLELTQGWRFLYSPARTLSPSTKLMFVGNNPGGGDYEPPIPSVEEGNAYRVESWQVTRFAKEVQLLFERMGEKLEPKMSRDELMDGTLTTNFCPFRSKDWTKFPKIKRQEAIDFSFELWGDIIRQTPLKPSVLICLGNLSFGHFREVFRGQGFVTNSSVRKATGWGKYEYTLEELSSSQGEELIILRLPHLANFKVISAKGCQTQSEELIKTVTDRLNENG